MLQDTASRGGLGDYRLGLLGRGQRVSRVHSCEGKAVVNRLWIALHHAPCALGSVDRQAGDRHRLAP
jgi:hypothetical protein